MHKQRILVQVSLEGIKLLDDETKVALFLFIDCGRYVEIEIFIESNNVSRSPNV